MNDQENDGIEDQSDDDNGTPDFIQDGVLTGHTRNPNRLDVALTSAKDGLVVGCRERLLCANPFSRKGKQQNALINMVTNARQRGLLFDSDHHEDTHPDAGTLIDLVGGKDKVDQLRKAEDKIDNNLKYGFIEQAKRASAQFRKQQSARMIDVPVYRTLEGHTTRPLSVGDKAAADAHDRMVEEQKEDAQKTFKISRVANATLN